MQSLSPQNEAQRLRTLELYRIVDSAAERSFDDLTRLAANICATPLSFVSIIGDDRQWSKSAFGTERGSMPRSDAFCSHTIHVEDLLIVEDAAADTRFAQNPMVVGDPHIRFYAGAPLEVGSGDRLGSLCIVDNVPRTMSAAQIESLKILRDAVVNLLELRRAKGDIDALTSLLPMCAWCRDVRVETESDTPTWRSLHDYVVDSVTVTHGICPRCKDAALAEEA